MWKNKGSALVSTQDSYEGPPFPQCPKKETGALYSGQFLSLSMAAVVLETLLTSHTHCLPPQIFISLNQSSVEGPITSVEEKQNRRNLRRPPETPRLSLVQRS